MEKYNDLSLVHENRLPQRAYYIPHPSLESALTRDKKHSTAYTCLNGEWNFAYFECPQDIPDDIGAIAYDAKLPVPSCWELYGYGQIQYTNKNYPFQYDPPYVEAINPVGVYRKIITVDADKASMENYIVFEGVSSCVELFVNGLTHLVELLFVALLHLADSFGYVSCKPFVLLGIVVADSAE